MAKNNDKTQRYYPGIKTACLAMLALLFLLACVLLRGDGGEILGGEDAAAGAGGHGFYYENLALMPGVEVTADSVENDSFLPQLAADGKKNAAGPAPMRRERRSTGCSFLFHRSRALPLSAFTGNV